MRKRCPGHERFEALGCGDAEGYRSSTKFHKPGTIPLARNRSAMPVRLRACCALAYDASGRLLLGDSFHPGGLELPGSSGA